jgi:nicotinamide-nucleotide amidase
MTQDKKYGELREFHQIVDKAGQLLMKKKNTIAVAESVTSGNIQAVLSLAKDATAFFQGGITVYNIGQKCRHLLVPDFIHKIE